MQKTFWDCSEQRGGSLLSPQVAPWQTEEQVLPLILCFFDIFSHIGNMTFQQIITAPLLDQTQTFKQETPFHKTFSQKNLCFFYNDCFLYFVILALSPKPNSKFNKVSRVQKESPAGSGEVELQFLPRATEADKAEKQTESSFN